MFRALVTVSLVLLAVGACPAAATGASTAPPTATAGRGSDLGNGRPHVSYDGLMVRRREAIAIRSAPGIDLKSLRTTIEAAAARRHLHLDDVSGSVLAPAMLEDLAPVLTLLLPPGATAVDARQLLGTSVLPPAVEAYGIAPVLVHDLRFTVRARRPAGLATDIAKEGILSDALGRYRTVARDHQLDITYTGPLLSDPLIAAVRFGIARRAGTEASAVTISPRTTRGVGVDVSREPPLPPAPGQATNHDHHVTVGALASEPGASAAGPHSRWVLPLVLALGAMIALLTLVQLAAFRRTDPLRSASTVRPERPTGEG